MQSLHLFNRWNYALSAAAVVFLLLAYYGAGTPSWVSKIDIGYLQLPPDFQTLHVLFCCELVAWSIVVFGQLLATMIYRDAQPTVGNQHRRIAAKRAAIGFDIAVASVVAAYHAYVVYQGDENILPRVALAVFSWIMLRQLLLNSIVLVAYLIPAVGRYVTRVDLSKDTLILQSRIAKRQFGYALTILFVIALAMVVWSPALLPSGVNPKYLALGLSISVAFVSFALTILVQHRMGAILDNSLAPLEAEIARSAIVVPTTASDIDRINGLMSIKEQLAKTYNLPTMTIVLNVLQAVGATVTIFLALVGLR